MRRDFERLAPGLAAGTWRHLFRHPCEKIVWAPSWFHKKRENFQPFISMQFFAEPAKLVAGDAPIANPALRAPSAGQPGHFYFDVELLRHTGITPLLVAVTHQHGEGHGTQWQTMREIIDDDAIHAGWRLLFPGRVFDGMLLGVCKTGVAVMIENAAAGRFLAVVEMATRAIDMQVEILSPVPGERHIEASALKPGGVCAFFGFIAARRPIRLALALRRRLRLVRAIGGDALFCFENGAS